MAAERGSKEQLRTGDDDHGLEFNVGGEGKRRVKRAKSMRKETPPEKADLGFFLSFAGSALQLIDRRARKEAEYIHHLFSGASFDAGERHRHVKKFDDCKQRLEDSRD